MTDKVSLTQFCRIAGLPPKWVKNRFKEGIPTDATLVDGVWQVTPSSYVINCMKERYKREKDDADSRIARYSGYEG